MQHPFFAHRRTLVAALFAGLALMVAPNSYGKYPDATSAVRESDKRPGSTEAQEQGTPSTLAGPARLLWEAQRENIPQTDTLVAAADPTSSDWTDELVIGAGLLAALGLAGGMTFVVRHRQQVSTIG